MDKKTAPKRRYDKRKEVCWNSAAVLEGRDPNRWRRDIDGRPVLHWLQNCSGPFCFSYDFPATGPCRVIQTHAYKLLKGESPGDHSPSIQISDLEMNMIERGIYGNIRIPTP